MHLLYRRIATYPKGSPTSVPDVRSNSSFNSGSPLTQIHFAHRDKIIAAIPERFKSELETVFNENIELSSTILQARVNTAKSGSLRRKIEEIIFGNLPPILQDTELPLSFHQLMASELPEIMSQIIQMVQVDLTLLGRDESAPYNKVFSTVSTGLRTALISHNDSKGFTWNVRQDKLWQWCRVMLEHTAHPRVRVFRANLADTLESDGAAVAQQAVAREQIAKINTLHDNQTRMIMEIAFIDDVADSLADKDLTDLFIKIPFADEPLINEVRATIADHDPIFLPYFNQAVKVWDAALIQFKELVTEPIYRRHEAALKERFTEIMQSMTYSVSMNLDYDSVIQEDIGKNLGPNMMVVTFRLMEEILLETLGAPPVDAEDNVIIQTIVVSSQRLASLSNAIATIYRELGESSKANELLFEISAATEKRLTQEVLVSGTSTPPESIGAEPEPTPLQREFEDFCRGNGYQNHFFQDYPQPSTFLDLLATRQLVVDNIFSTIQTMKHDRKSFTYEASDGPAEIAKKLVKSIDAGRKESKINKTLEGQVTLLKRYLQRLELIDQYSVEQAKRSQVVKTFLGHWQTTYDQMLQSTREISDSRLQAETVKYVESFKTFLAMYSLFKHKTHGAI
jgi:hypothetical protein